jgi:predicted regulator of Ras-like GTPase activity (Roadblock/LC7/MglB family)
MKTHQLRINMSNAALDQAQNILTAMNGQYGILGCLLVSVIDGELLACSLPSDIDTGLISSLCATLFSNNRVSIRKMNRGDLAQMTLVTERGILHFYHTGSAILVVLTARGQRVSLEGLLRLTEEQGQALTGLIN